MNSRRGHLKRLPRFWLRVFLCLGSASLLCPTMVHPAEEMSKPTGQLLLLECPPEKRIRLAEVGKAVDTVRTAALCIRGNGFGVDNLKRLTIGKLKEFLKEPNQRVRERTAGAIESISRGD